MRGKRRAPKHNIQPYQSSNITASVVTMNDGVNICAQACACCWDTKLPSLYEQRAEYVGRRTKIGHTSVIEHSNLTFYCYIPEEYSKDLILFESWCRFLHLCVKPAVATSGYHMLVGGSWRAYADLYLMADEEIADNAILRIITNRIYRYVPSQAMNNIIELGLLSRSEFFDPEVNTSADMYCLTTDANINENIRVVNCDEFQRLIEQVRAECQEPELFTYADLLQFLTITIEFKGMSRIITQQLCRHRNAITQESQRYVDYKGAPFNSPTKYTGDLYDPKRLYPFEFGGKVFKMTLQAIGDAINGIYGQLSNKDNLRGSGLKKEDARAFLANNTQCGTIYITFTYYNLIKFLELREDSHAQPEIRWFATEIGKWFRRNALYMTNGELDELAYTALAPKIYGEDFFFNPISEPTNLIRTVDADKNEVGEELTPEEYAKLYSDHIQAEESVPEEEKAPLPDEEDQ